MASTGDGKSAGTRLQPRDGQVHVEGVVGAGAAFVFAGDQFTVLAGHIGFGGRVIAFRMIELSRQSLFLSRKQSVGRFGCFGRVEMYLPAIQWPT